MPTYWEDLNWADFQELVPEKFPAAIIAVGTLEAHGVGPIGTDNIIPIDLVDQIADDISALVCPPINYGQVGGLAGYPGSVAIDENVLLAYCEAVFSGIADWGFSSLVVMNGHGGNTQTLKKAARTVHIKTGIKVLVVDWWYLATPACEEVYGQVGGHAGADENGYVQAIRPETIHPEKMGDHLIHVFNPAVSTYPYPGTVLISKEGQGAPVFDDDKAKRYREGAIALVRDYCHKVLTQWDANGL